MTPIVVYYDFQSPFSFILSEVLEARLADSGATPDWRPIELERLSNYTAGWPYSKTKRAYVVRDAIRQAAFHEVAIATPRPFPVDSGLARRVAMVARRHGDPPALRSAIFRAAWQQQRDLSDATVLGELIEACGAPAADWLDAAASPEVAAALTDSTAEAEAAGVFGVPTLVLREELFWGVDSLPLLEWTLRRTD